MAMTMTLLLLLLASLFGFHLFPLLACTPISMAIFAWPETLGFGNTANNDDDNDDDDNDDDNDVDDDDDGAR